MHDCSTRNCLSKRQAGAYFDDARVDGDVQVLSLRDDRLEIRRRRVLTSASARRRLNA